MGASEFGANTTNFVQDSTKVMSDFSHITVADDMSIQDQTLADFLAKPQLIYNSTWTTSDADNLQLYNFSIANLIETTSYWANKVQGYNLY